MTTKLERRKAKGSREVRVVTSQLELRDDGSAGDNIVRLVGHPIKYGVGYKVRDMYGSFEEKMHYGVMTDLLANPAGLDCRFLFNHDGMPLARTLSGTLTLEDGPNGLRSIANLDTRQQLACDLAIAVERGDVSQMSVGMIVGEDAWDAREEHRDIYKLSALLDVSAVTFPASTTTDIGVARARGGRMTTADLRREVDAMRAERRSREHERLQRLLRAAERRRVS